MYGTVHKRRCQVVVLNAFSAHADRDELLENVKNCGAKKILCVHGEETALQAFQERIESELGKEAVVLKEGEGVEI